MKIKIILTSKIISRTIFNGIKEKGRQPQNNDSQMVGGWDMISSWRVQHMGKGVGDLCNFRLPLLTLKFHASDSDFHFRPEQRYGVR